MKKRNVLIFSALIVSMFIVASCQNTVGGSVSPSYGNDDCVFFKVGDAILVKSGDSTSCYEITGCETKGVTKISVYTGEEYTVSVTTKPKVKPLTGGKEQRCQGANIYNQNEVISDSGSSYYGRAGRLVD